MAVRKSTTTTVTGPTQYAVKKGRVVGTTRTTTSITKTPPRIGQTLELLRLPVYMLLFWLLVMAPFFTVMTTVQDGRVILADEFRVQESTEFPEELSGYYWYYFGVDNPNFYNIQNQDGSLTTTGWGGQWTYESDHILFEIFGGNTFLNIYGNIDNFDNINLNFETIAGGTNNSAIQLISWNNPNFSNFEVTTIINDNNTNLVSIVTSVSIEVHKNKDVFVFSVNGGGANGSSRTREVKLFELTFDDFGFSSLIIPEITYYDIMENARLADYQNVDSFTNIFYTIPRMASSLAEAYNRFINWTVNVNEFLNPFNEAVVENLDPDGWLMSLATTLQSWIRGEDD